MKKTLIKLITSLMTVMMMLCVAASPLLAEGDDEIIETEEPQEDEPTDTLTFEAQVEPQNEEPETPGAESSDEENNEPTEPEEKPFEIGEVSLSLEYEDDYSSAVIIIEYTGDGKIELFNSDDYDEAEKLDMLSWIIQKDDRIELRISTNGVYAFIVNILDGEGNVLEMVTQSAVVNQIGNQVTAKIRSAKSAPLRSGNSNESSQSVDIYYTSIATFDWTIPSEVDLSSSSTFNVSIDTEEALANNYGVSVRVSSANNFRLIGTSSDYAYGYTISNSDGETITNGQTVLAYKSSDTDTVSETLTVDTSAMATTIYSDVYSDTLTFNASFNIAPYTKLSLNNGERTVYVMAYKGDDQYLVIERNSIGNKPFHTADAACGINSETSGCDNTYENSELDTYLNTTWYNSLSSELKNAIVDAEIYQEFYTHKGDSGICYDKNGSTRVGDHGNHPYSTDWNKYGRVQTWNGGATSATLTRKVFLPSLKEIIGMGVDLDNYNSTRSFLTESSGSMVHLWTRDGYASVRQLEMFLYYHNGSPDNDYLWVTYIGVRPAYIIDLSEVSYSITN